MLFGIGMVVDTPSLISLISASSIRNGLVSLFEIPLETKVATMIDVIITLIAAYVIYILVATSVKEKVYE